MLMLALQRLRIARVACRDLACPSSLLARSPSTFGLSTLRVNNGLGRGAVVYIYIYIASRKQTLGERISVDPHPGYYVLYIHATWR